MPNRKAKRTKNKNKTKKEAKAAKAAMKRQAAAIAAERDLKIQATLRNAMFDPNGKTPKNVLNDFKPFKKYKKANFAADICFFTAETIPKLQLQSCFELLKVNMHAMYNACPEWGWKDKAKMRELKSPEARYLVVYTEGTSDICAFVHFRFCAEEDKNNVPVLYMYELQVSESARRKGLGKRLTQVPPYDLYLLF